MQELRLVPLRELSDVQVLELAQLHHTVMHSLLTELGLPFLERYYRALQDDGNVLGFCALSEEGAPLGWVMGSPKPDQVNSRLREPLTWFVMQLLRLLVTHPLVLGQLVSSVLTSSNQTDMNAGSIELTYIGVSEDQSGSGLGTKLINHFIEATREAEYHSVVLSVETDNQPALALYEKTGFKITKTFSEGRYQRYRMELSL